MTPMLDPSSPPVLTDTDLTATIRRVLAASAEPLTLSKLRSRLPASYRAHELDALSAALERPVAAGVLYQFPRYRSQQDRFWDRPMPVHVAALLRAALEDDPLDWPRLRRKLPAYALPQAEAVLDDQVAQGRLHRHPPAAKRTGARFGVRPPDPKDYLRAELSGVFERLERLGFRRPALREAALELLHEEEWTAPAAAPVAAVSPVTPS